MAPLISGCLIVKNEAQNLARCLTSIQSYIDELVVVDTGSTDETVEIARDFNATLHHFEWCDDFSAARNFALEQVHGHWILMIDADEELIVEDKEWRSQLQGSESKVFSISLYASDGDASVFPAIRIFRNHKYLRYKGRFHESLEWNGQRLTAINALIGIHLLHYGYQAKTLLQKAQVRIPILERLRQEEELSLLLLWTLMGMYLRTEQWEHAQTCLNEASERLFEPLLLGEKPKDFRSVLSWIHTLGENCYESEDYEGLRLICTRALEWCPTYPPLVYLTGLLLDKLGFLRGAIPYFEQCVKFGETGIFYNNEPFDQRFLSVLPLYQLGDIYRRLNETDVAAKYLRDCLKLEPNFTLAQKQLKAIQMEV